MKKKQKKFLLQLIDQVFLTVARDRRQVSLRTLIDTNGITEDDMRDISSHIWNNLTTNG